MPRRAALLLVLALASGARACYNDRDTEIRERASPPEVLRALTGAFVRLPDAYYLDRIARLRAKTAPTNSERDDLAVAYGRLGREREGLAALAGATPKTPDEHYRLRANRGTLLAHLALRRRDRAMLARAEDDVAEALRIDPKAHFGREGVQLSVIRWARGVLANPARGSAGPETLGTFLGGARNSEPQATARALAGLVELGGAWESPDVVAAIGALLPRVEEAEGSTHLLRRLDLDRAGAYARLRYAELLASGREPFHPDAGKDVATETTSDGRAVFERTIIADGGALGAETARFERDFRAERAAAEGATRARAAYLERGLKAGRHPDTDLAFWKGWHEPNAPVRAAPAPRTVRNPNRGRQGRAIAAALALAAGVAALFLAVVALMVVRLLRRRTKPRR